MTDWSETMTEVLKDLRLAEEELRLVHMNPLCRERARISIWKAQARLLELDEWCKVV